ncbi:MAG: UbiA family prenyltransferase [Pseudomonadota bacterium]
MLDRFKTILELIRFPGMFTAHADILAAFLITRANMDQIIPFLFIILSTSCLFSAGMALNDYFDYLIDLEERPERPIPSNRVSRPFALSLGILLLVAGTGFALAAGFRPFCISLALVFAILCYNGGLKHHPIIGPLFMASCRYFNLLMGLSVLLFPGWTLVPLITGVYIFGVTVLSQKEATGGKATKTISLAALCVGSTGLIYYFFYLNDIFNLFTGVLLAMGLAMFLSFKIMLLLEHHQPKDFQITMKKLLLSIIVLNTVLAAGVAPLYQASAILLLYLPALLSVRLFRVT